MSRPSVALVHDYIAAFGGGERVVLSMARAFPGAPIHTSVYEPDRTFEEFRQLPVRTSWLQHVADFRHHHRHMLPLLAPTFASLRPRADVTICSTTGWCHGARPTGAKILYVHNTPRWLYQRESYLADASLAAQASLCVISPALRRYDVRAGTTADLVLVNSRNVQDRVRRHWGCESVVLYPPHRMRPELPGEPVDGLERGYWLSVGRLVNYKNFDVVLRAMSLLPAERLVVLGEGPLGATLRAEAGANCSFVGKVSEAGLNWLYANSCGLVAAADEDLGLAPLQAMAFGRPVVALRRGGYLETVVEGATGLFFDRLDPTEIAGVMAEASASRFDAGAISAEAARYGEDAFVERLTELVRAVWRGDEPGAQTVGSSEPTVRS